MFASSCQTYLKNSLMNTTLAKLTNMVEYISKSSADATASLNLDDLQTTSYAPGLRKLTIMKPLQHRASGVTSGVLSSLFYR